jgi:NAD(P)-dependent dehydrogenase (short-subunit alcohol dehydrogenase family)
MQDFQDRVAVITGAAGVLGRQLANAAAALDMKLVLADADAGRLEREATALQDNGAELLAMVCDVRRATHVGELADAAMARFHGVHLVFNNAGACAGGRVWESSVADWERMLGVNLWGAIHGVRVFVPLMLECARRTPGYRGHIVNTASMAGLVNAPATGAYNAAEHALVSLSETLYHDLRRIDAPIGASVLCPCPGTVCAGEVAQLTFDAIRAERFWILPHPQGLDAVAERMDAIVHARPPPDPHAATPRTGA